MGIEIYKNGLRKNENGWIASSKTWSEGTRYRKQLNVDNGSVTQRSNLIITDMSGWTNKPTGADWTNYVRVYRKGLYNATYNFEGETGETGSSISWCDIAGTSVIAEKYGHGEVLEFTAGISNYNTFTAETSGTVEFWWQIDDLAERTRFQLIEPGLVDCINMWFDNGDIEYEDNASVWQTICSIPKINEWHHIRIDFECAGGAYLGLAADTFFVTVDGTQYGPYGFHQVAVDLNRLYFSSVNANSYIDGIGYSWDTDYTVDDNRTTVEGAEIEITSQTVHYDTNQWNDGNHDAVVFLYHKEYSDNDEFVIYYGDTDLGAPGYSTDLTVTADSPNAGDYTVQQDDYYKTEITVNGANAYQGGNLLNLWTRVSGANVQIGAANAFYGAFIWLNQAGVDFYSYNEQAPTVVLAEDGPVLAAIKVSGVIEDVGNNPLQDSGATNVTYGIIYLFCDCQLFYVKVRFDCANQLNNIQRVGLNESYYVNAYFSHQSYLFTGTQAEEAVQDRDLSVNWASKQYICYFDPTSDDGVAVHFTDENVRLEDSQLKLNEAATEQMQIRPDNSGDNDNMDADTYDMEIWFQIDDFSLDVAATEVTAYTKSNELQAATSQTTLTAQVF